MRLDDFLAWQARIIRVAVILREPCDTGTRHRIDVEVFGHGIASEDSVFQIFIGHINIGDKLIVRHHRHSLGHGPVRNGHRFQLSRLHPASPGFHSHGHRFIFRHHLSRRLWLDDVDLNSRDSRDIRAGQ